MYVLFEHPLDVKEKMPSWAENVVPYEEILGYSSLGLVFLREPKQAQFAILQPLRGGLSRLGQYESLADFKTELLDSPGVVSDFLRPDDIEYLKKRIGALDPEEVYYPQPYPFLGGSGALDTYDKGNLWVFLEIVLQMLARASSG